MRIAIFSDNFHPELGGIQDSIEALAKALAARGHQVDFYAPRYGSRDYRKIGATPFELDLGENVRIHRLRSLPFPSSSNQSRMVVPSPFPRLARWRQSRPDVIHTQTFYGVGLEAILAGKLLGIPIVGTNHTAIKAFVPYMPVKMEWAVNYVLWYYNLCDLVTAPSRSVFEDLGSAELRRPHLVISNPIDTETFHPVSPETRQVLKRTLGLSDATIVYAGRLAAEKNIEVIFRAVAMAKARHPSLALVLAGHGSDARRLRGLATELQIDSNVRFLGTLEKQPLADLFRASEIFVTMSTSETQGMALLQAMACALPVIGANARALPEYIDHANGFTVDPHDPAALAERISLLLESERRRRDMGRAGAAFAQQFSVHAVASQWQQTYRSLVGKEMVASWQGI